MGAGNLLLVTAPAPKPQRDNYWADSKAEEFAPEFFNRIGGQQLGGGVGYIARLQLKAMRHYYGALPALDVGLMPSAAALTRAGEQGEKFELRVNWIRNKINSRHQLIVAPELTWTSVAANTDAKSMADATAGTEILEQLWKTGPYNKQAQDAVLGGILFGEEFMFVTWDTQGGEQKAFDQQNNQVMYTGGLRCFNVASWDVFRDGSAKSFEESDWVCARLSVNRWDLIAKYPSMRVEILAAASPATASQAGVVGQAFSYQQNDDKVNAYYFFHKKRPCLPLGLQAVLLNDKCVLEYLPLEACNDPIPLHRFAMGNIKGTPWPYTDTFDLMATQELATSIHGGLATNIITFGHQMVAAEEGSNMPVDQIGQGPGVIYYPKGGEPPVPLQLTASPPEAFQHLDRIEADMNKGMGLNDVALGQAPSNTKDMNAEAFALLSSAAVTANGTPQHEYVRIVQNVGRSVLKIFKDKATTPQQIAITGLHSPLIANSKTFDRTSFAGLEDVLVDVAPAMMQTTSGKLQMAQLYQKANFIQSPEQLQAVVETGKLQPLTQVWRDEMNCMAWENEQILKGINPPVKMTDSHQAHIREHKGPTFSAAARMDPKINTAADAHIAAHMAILTNPANAQALTIMGQAVPQPPPQMPVAPPEMHQPPQQKGPGQTPLNHAAGVAEPPLQQQPFAQQPQISQIKQPINPMTGNPAGPPGKLPA